MGLKIDFRLKTDFRLKLIIALNSVTTVHLSHLHSQYARQELLCFWCLCAAFAVFLSRQVNYHGIVLLQLVHAGADGEAFCATRTECNNRGNCLNEESCACDARFTGFRCETGECLHGPF